jgi:uncharacterized LabA/DUF88 family protein
MKFFALVVDCLTTERRMDNLYVDGGGLDAAIDDLRRSLGVATVEFDYLKLGQRFGAARTLYYDAWPGLSDQVTDEAIQSARDKKGAFFEKIASLDGVHVRTGTTRWERKGPDKKWKPNQKAVDVLLAVDVTRDALLGNIDRALILTSDLDFYPVFEALLQSQVRSTLIFRPGHTKRDLIEVADSTIPLRALSLLECCDENFAVLYRPIPDVYFRDLSDDERARAATCQFRNRELAVWQDSDGLFVAAYGTARVKSPSKDRVVEYWSRIGRMDALTFSDGTVYP